MAADRELIRRAAEALADWLGPIDLASPLFAFDHSDYYAREMGPALVKQFFSFRGLRSPLELAAIKRRTAACERRHRAPGGGRLVNLDPGYWMDAKLVLASTKNYSHRIPLGRRVFGELTLRYHRGKLQPFDWTYPDYRTPLALEFFERVRRAYLEQLAD